MIRDSVRGKITPELCARVEIKSHLCTCCEILEVLRNGDLLEKQEVSFWGYIPKNEVLHHAEGVCNCDWCAECDELSLVDDDKEEFIADCVYNNDLSQLENALLEKIDSIPWGYFDDEA